MMILFVLENKFMTGKGSTLTWKPCTKSLSEESIQVNLLFQSFEKKTGKEELNVYKKD